MTAGYGAFAADLARGREGEDRVIAWLRDIGAHVTRASSFWQRLGVDLFVQTRPGAAHATLAVEVKWDSRAAETGNAYLELWANWQDGAVGWALGGQADALLYCIPARESCEAILVASSRVRALARAHSDAIQAGARGVSTRSSGALGLAVPLDALRECAQWRGEVGDAIEW